eukprot:3384783-Amphidinium_carterae.3
MVVRQLFKEVGGVLDAGLALGRVVTTFAIFEAHHLVCIVRPNCAASLGLAVGQTVHVVNEHFQHERASAAPCRQQITVRADLEKCLFFEGGVRTSSSGSACVPQVGTPSSTSVTLFAPDVKADDPVADCLLWAYKAQRIEPVIDGIAADQLRAMVRMWLATAEKFSYIIAGGVTVAQIASWWDMDVSLCIEHLCSITNALEINAVFIYVAGCVLSTSVALVDSEGECQDGFLRTRGFGLQRSHGFWRVIAPFADSESIIQELSPTIAFVEHCGSSSSTLASDPPLPVADHIPMLEGGGKRGRAASDSSHRSPSRHSRRSDAMPELPSGELQSEVFLPAWTLRGPDADRRLQTIFVSVGQQPPVSISVPCYWSTTHTEDKIATHIGAKRSWLSFTWANMDVFIEPLGSHPRAGDAELNNLRILADSVTAHDPVDLPDATGVAIGATETGNFLSEFTRSHVDFVRSITTAMTSLLPDAIFDFISLEQKAPQRQRFALPCDARLGITLIPQPADLLSWIWIACDTGTELADVDGHDIFGVYIPFNRIIFCPPGAEHRFHTASQVNAIAIYRSQIVPSPEQVATLHELGFPLDLSQLGSLRAADDRRGAPAIDSAAVPIGAPVNRRAAMPPPAGKPVKRKSSACGSGSAGAGTVLPIGARQPPSKRGSSLPPTPRQLTAAAPLGFKRSVLAKLEMLEKQQTEILQLLRQQQAPPSALDSRAEVPVSSKLVPRSRRSIGAPSTAAPSGTAPWRRGGCMSFFRRSVAKLRAVGKLQHQLTIHSGKAKPLHMRYIKRLSSKQILEFFAAKKRVGRQYLALKLRTADGDKTVGPALDIMIPRFLPAGTDTLLKL